ncbi:MAG: hypothetical protein ACI9DC_001245, partial [Gammaproteobacteria bacterium]
HNRISFRWGMQQKSGPLYIDSASAQHCTPFICLLLP